VPRLPTWLTFAAGVLTGAALVASLFLYGPLAAPPELEPGELVILSGQDDSSGGQRQQLVNLWNNSHPRNRARIVPLPQSADGQYAEMVQRAEDSGIDVFNLDVAWTARFADPPSGRPLIRPIDEDLLVEPPDRAFMEKPLETCRYDGKLWALPFNTDAGLLYFRADQGLKPPFTWPALQAVKPAERGFKAVYTSQLDDYEGLTVNVLETVWALGGDLTVDESGRVSLNLAKWDEAVRTLTPRRDGAPGLVLPDSLRYSEAGSRDAFQEGQALFMRNWPVAYRTMLAADQPRAAGRPQRFGVTRLPGDSVLGGQNLAIAERSRKPRAAQALIEFLTSAESQRALFEKGGFAATRAAVYEDEGIKEKYPYLPELRGAIETARLRPVSPNYDAFSKLLIARVHEVLTGAKGELPRDLAEQLSRALRGE
jgi:multiple sugar transport system substrate-binding protein